MDNNGQITEEQKNEVYKKIVDIMLVALENGAMTAEDSEEASMFILNGLEKTTDEFYMASVIEEFVSRWPIFSPLLQPQREEQSKIEDAQNIANIQSELNNFKQ